MRLRAWRTGSLSRLLGGPKRSRQKRASTRNSRNIRMTKNCKHSTCEGEYCRRPPKPKPRRIPIRKYSKKRSKDNRSYSALRKEFLSEHPECEARLKMCRGEATDIHHMAGRVGDNLLDTDTWLAVCRPCHLWIEAHPEQSKELGLSESRLKTKVQKGVLQ